MGTSSKEAAQTTSAASIHRFYSEDSWIEGAAEDQLHAVAAMKGVLSVAAFPDLHPGKYGPVGCAIVSDRIYPQLIGNDIGCGMSVYALDIPARKLRLDKAAERLRTLEDLWDGNAGARLASAGLDPDLHPQSLGTLGGGNHFCELQVVDTVHDEAALREAGLVKGGLVLLVHSGSRSLGTSVFSSVQNHFGGLGVDSSMGQAYMETHNQAVAWASLNRTLIAERAAKALRSGLRQVCDAPHNLIESHKDGLLHRKGAAKSDSPVVPLAGSRDALSFLLKPLHNKAEALASLAHGAGRKYDRRSMMGRAGLTRSGRASLSRNAFGGMVICDDRQLLIEEAGQAYKDPANVVRELQSAGLAEPISELKPLITFKKAVTESHQTEVQEKLQRLKDRRAAR